MKNRTIGIWLGFPYKLHLKREGITRFIYYFIKHFLKNYPFLFEIWCYRVNYQEVKEIFKDILTDKELGKRIKILTEESFQQLRTTRKKVFQKALRYVYSILVIDKEISWKFPYRYYLKEFPLDIKSLKKSFSFNKLIDIFFIIILFITGLTARLARKVVLKDMIFKLKEVLIFEMNASEFYSNTGNVKVDSIIAGYDENPGFIIYGKYMNLAEGFYELEVSYKFSGTNSNSRWDITFNHGRDLLYSGKLPYGENVFKITFFVREEYENTPFEFRVWFAGKEYLEIKKVRIFKKFYLNPYFEFDILASCANRLSKSNLFIIPIVTLYNAVWLKKKKVVFIHDLTPFVYYDYFVREKIIDEKWIKECSYHINKFIEQGAHFVCNSDFVRKEHLFKFFNFHKEYTDYVYVPVNHPDKIHSRISSKEELLLKYKLPATYIFYPTQIRPYKNVITLLKALVILRNKNINIHLVLTGNPDHSAEIRDFIIQNGLERTVLFIPDVPEIDLYALHKFAVATVVPTLFEGGFPWQGLEAMLMGTPAIMSAIPVTLERLKAEGFDVWNCGLLLFNPEDPEELSEKIVEVMNNREETLKRQSAVANKLLTYNWDDASRAYYKILKRYIYKRFLFLNYYLRIKLKYG